MLFASFKMPPHFGFDTPNTIHFVEDPNKGGATFLEDPNNIDSRHRIINVEDITCPLELIG